jgi:hypothetical protein
VRRAIEFLPREHFAFGLQIKVESSEKYNAEHFWGVKYEVFSKYEASCWVSSGSSPHNMEHSSQYIWIHSMKIPSHPSKLNI